MGPDDVRDGVVAGLVAWLASEVPSVVGARLRGRPWWSTDLAAGALLLHRATSAPVLLGTGVATRALVGVNWGLVLARFLDRRHPVAHGAAAGLALAGFQYGLVGRRRPAIRSVGAAAQVVDHVTYGAAVGWVLGRR